MNVILRAGALTGRQTLFCSRLKAGQSLVAACGFADKPPVKKDDLPDTEYNPYMKVSNPRSLHWRHKYSDIRWQYLQDPDVESGNIVPTPVKDGPERDKVNWPDPVQKELPGRTRLGLIPEELFNLMYSKTGVTGGYVLIWGSLGYAWSQEWLRWDNESVVFLYTYVLPIVVINRYVIPRAWAYMKKNAQFSMTVNDAFKNQFIYNLELTNAQDKLNYEMVHAARKQKFLGMKEMFQLQWEATYRQRLFEAYEKVKARLDYQSDLVACKKKHENRHMVKWIVDSVVKGITPDLEKAALAKCITDLKALSATGVKI